MQREVTSGIQLAALGNPLIDIYAPVSQEAIRAAGLKPGSAVHGEVGRDGLLFQLDQQFMGPGGRIAVDKTDGCGRFFGQKVHAYPAGGAFTAARLLAEAGKAAVFCGAVGADGGADLFRAASKGSGLHLHLAETPEGTGRCRYLYDPEHPGPLTIAVTPGAARSLVIDESCSDFLKQAAWVYIEGFVFLGIGRDLFSALQPTALAVDLASEFAAAVCRPLILQAAQGKELVLFGTADEFAALFACRRDEVEQSCTAFVHGGDKQSSGKADITCMIKSGPFGVASISRRGVVRHQAPQMKQPPLERFSIGAGDAFSAGYLAGKIDGSDEMGCLDAGTESAARALTAEGPPFPFPPTAGGSGLL
jgi:sugar/nucleoside kinase (ribokinase family)